MMKKFLLICFLLISFTVQGQTTIGLLYGMGHSQVQLGNETSVSRYPVFGIGVEACVTTGFSVKSAMEYHIREYDITFTAETTPPEQVKSEFRSEFVDIPVLLKYNLPFSTNAATFLFLGPTFSILLTEELHQDGDHYLVDGPMKGFSLGVTIGTGLDIKTGAGNLGLDLRYGRNYLLKDQPVIYDGGTYNFTEFFVLLNYSYPIM